MVNLALTVRGWVAYLKGMAEQNPTLSTTNPSPVASAPVSPAVELGASVPTVSELSSVVRRQIVPLAVVVIGIVALAALLTSLMTPTYAATSEVLLRTDATAQLFPLGGGDDNGRIRSVSAELEYVRSDSFQLAASNELGNELGTGNDGLEMNVVVDVSAKQLPATNLRGEATTLVFDATGTTAEQAASAANIYAETYVSTRRQLDLVDHERRVSRTEADLSGVTERLEELQEPIAEIDGFIASSRDLETTIALLQERTRVVGQQSTERTRLDSELSRLAGQLRTLQVEGVVLESENSGAAVTVAAEAPLGQASPNLIRNLILATMLGLVLGVAVALWRDRSDTKLRDPLELATTGHALLGVLPASADRPDAVRSLATSVDFAGSATSAKVIQVASATEGEGSEVVAAELASMLARFGRRVVLVDADLRDASLSNVLGLRPALGLTDMLEAPIDALESTEIDGMSFLGAGTSDRDAAELLASPTLARLFGHMRNHFDVIIVSSPAVLGTAACRMVGREADGFVLVAAKQMVRASDVSSALQLVIGDGQQVLGSVFNEPTKLKPATAKAGSPKAGSLKAGSSESDAQIPEASATERILAKG